jgi:diaminopimelate epimerase
MRFVKAHGAGNDFVLIEDLDDAVRPNGAFVEAVCDRHFGIGGDGLIRIAPSATADFFMDYYNADGEVAEMCGNGIRCLAKYVGDRGLARADTFTVDTRAGVKTLMLYRGEDGSVERVRVDMGAPILDREAIPLAGDGDPLHEPIDAAGFDFDAACVSMGNPHCVLFHDDPDALPFEALGPMIETHERFPARTNVEFVRVLSSRAVHVRVSERGVGETLACGTGACAVVVAGALRGLIGRSVAVHLPGGTLDVEWAEDDHVLMTGPVEEVFAGELGVRLESLLPTPTITQG